jgi:hypothetical protein
MKKILLIIAILGLAGVVDAQQLYHYKYIMVDDYFMNPAYVGTNDYYNMALGYENRFTGINESPQTVFFDAHSRVGKGYLFEKDGKVNRFFSKFGSSAFGTQILYYSFGAQYEFDFAVTYGYHIKLSPNYKTKNPRKLVLALTPRIHTIGINVNKLVNNDGLPVDRTGDDLIPDDASDKLRTTNIRFDVGALYQNPFCDVGLTCSNLSNSKNKFELESITIDTTTYETYKKIYSPKFIFDTKLKFVDIIDEEKFNLNFRPQVAVLYGMNTKDVEFFTDLSLVWSFYDVKTAVRKELMYCLKTGVDVNRTSYYKPMTLIQPYVSFDFKNYVIKYVYSFNGNINVPGYFGSNQISILWRISRDRNVRTVGGKGYWD